MPVQNSLLEKGYHFVAQSSTYYQKLSTLQFNFHYWLSSHCKKKKKKKLLQGFLKYWEYAQCLWVWLFCFAALQMCVGVEHAWTHSVHPQIKLTFRLHHATIQLFCLHCTQVQLLHHETHLLSSPDHILAIYCMTLYLERIGYCSTS